ncbi:MAG: 30S ribosome-binding factor RbfA [Alphaproteobacteria bacterium GM202ARS2]|nr:30S ribosome-binding factor RbfA [Alphaproteobacteria bacterium GM202ARS2]
MTTETRRLRVAENVRRTLAHIIERETLPAPELKGQMLTVTRTWLSKDMGNVTVYVVPLNCRDSTETIEALGACAGWLRHRLSQKLVLKRMPRLHFVYDGQFDAMGGQKDGDKKA